MMPLLGAVIDWHSFFFYLFSLVAGLFAIAVVFTSNVVRMAFYLTISLGATAGLFFLAGAEFVGAMQLMIYVGGTLVLLIFGVMLTAQERFVTMRASAADWVIAAAVGGSLLAVLLFAAWSVDDWKTARVDRDQVPITEARAETPLGLGLLGAYDDGPGYLLPFEIVSVHLLVVLIGAAYLARAKRRRAPAAPRRGGFAATAPSRELE